MKVFNKYICRTQVEYDVYDIVSTEQMIKIS